MQVAGTRHPDEEEAGSAFEAFEQGYLLDGRWNWPEGFWGDDRVCDDLGPLQSSLKEVSRLQETKHKAGCDRKKSSRKRSEGNIGNLHEETDEKT
jgi:hypothetical protein